jgi:hypothetical protein
MLQEARSVVRQPQQQKLKLKVAQKSGIKIKFGGARDSPASTPGPSTPGMDRGTPGIVVNNDALSRQQDFVNGTRPSITNGNSHASGISTHTSRSASAASPPAQTNGVKHEGSLPPPANYPQQFGNALRPASGSPYPQTQPAYHPPVSSHGPPGLNIPKYRPANQGESSRFQCCFII